MWNHGTRGTAGAFWLAKTGECAAFESGAAEDADWISGDTWQFVIGCLNFYHLNNLNSIILL